MQNFWMGIAVGVGCSLLTGGILLFLGFMKTLISLPTIMRSIRRGVECLLEGQIKQTQVTTKVIVIQQASLEFIRDQRNNGNITHALAENAQAKKECDDIATSTQEFLVEEFSGGK